MLIGVPKEIKVHEYRVGLTPASVVELTSRGHQVVVEQGAGLGIGFSDGDYQRAGADIGTVDAAFDADLIVKVKEPQLEECARFRPGQILFTYLHLAAAEELTRVLIKSGSIGIAYETIQKTDGSLPLLTPMSEVAGKMAIQQGAKYLEKPVKGKGVLLGGVPGVPPGRVLVLGAGTVGIQAAKMAAGLGAQVYILDTNLERLAYLDDVMPANVFPIMSNPASLREYVTKADLVIGAVLVHGAKAPKLITRDMLKEMKTGAVLVDVAIDQGGCFETSKATTHGNPIYTVDGVVHYCVANMPGAVAKTSTLALTNATLPYAVEIANKGWKKAMQENTEIKLGANVIDGKVTYQAVAEAILEATNPGEAAGTGSR